MAKNNHFINSMRKTGAKFIRDVEEMTACTAICLVEYSDMKKEDIPVMLGNIQSLWCDCINDHIDPVELCKEKTGYDVRRKDGGKE